MSSLTCTKCKKSFPLHEKIWKCECGGLLDIIFSPSFPIDKIAARKPDMWRYREAIPIVHDENIVSFGEGFTPMVEIDFNNTPVFIKQDYLFPTGSFKDRGSSVLVSRMKELGIKKIIDDTSGNAGASLAAYSAKAGIECEIYVPETTSEGKLAQIQLYGAALKKVTGSREQAAREALRAAEKCYYASHSWYPFYFHGTKTFAFEVCEQLGWKAPDTVVVPVGNGTLLLGAHIGFRDLQNAGITGKMPRLIAVQSARCAPLYRTFKENLPEIPKITGAFTLAEGIAVAEPIRGNQIVDAVRETNGDFICVEESEIGEALREIGSKGFYCEPTSAATIAGVKKYVKRMENNELIVSVLTGHGLKSTETILKMLHE